MGLRLVRFTYEDVVHRPNWVVACVFEALGAVPNPCRFPRTDGTDVNC